MGRVWEAFKRGRARPHASGRDRLVSCLKMGACAFCRARKLTIKGWRGGWPIAVLSGGAGADEVQGRVNPQNGRRKPYDELTLEFDEKAFVGS